MWCGFGICHVLHITLPLFIPIADVAKWHKVKPENDVELLYTLTNRSGFLSVYRSFLCLVVAAASDDAVDSINIRTGARL